MKYRLGKNRKGDDIRVFQITEDELHAHRDEYNGICLGCGAVAYGDTEPDAEKYKCESCGELRVYGFEQAFMMGRVELL